jgi:hypothetical protein
MHQIMQQPKCNDGLTRLDRPLPPITHTIHPGQATLRCSTHPHRAPRAHCWHTRCARPPTSKARKKAANLGPKSLSSEKNLQRKSADGSIHSARSAWKVLMAAGLAPLRAPRTSTYSDVSFTIHAHIVRTAPFRLLLGHPFHLCRLEVHLNRVDG